MFINEFNKSKIKLNNLTLQILTSVPAIRARTTERALIESMDTAVTAFKDSVELIANQVRLNKFGIGFHLFLIMSALAESISNE